MKHDRYMGRGLFHLGSTPPPNNGEGFTILFYFGNCSTRKIQSRSRILFVLKEKEKYRENPKKVIIATNNGFRSRLYKGNVLALITYIVLDENHLDCLSLE